MITPTNAENLRKYTSTFALIVEQILAFANFHWFTDLIGKVNNLSPNFKKMA